jgi:methionine transaminase
MLLKSKLPNAGTTIFTTMSALAREHNAINLSQGFPDFECDVKLKELAVKYMKSSHQQYAPMPGTIQLRERITEMISNCYGVTVNPETEVTVTAGATQAIYTAISAFVNAGDEVIVFEPAYDCYVPAIVMNGGVPVYSRLSDVDFSINWADVRKKITRKTRAILINSPHNPTGAVITAADVQELERIVNGTDILVLSDEVYEHMIFDAKKHESILKSKALYDQSVIICSFGKTVHTTGWKIGYTVAPPLLTTEIRRVHQFLVFAVNHPLQLALAEYLAEPANYTALKQFYEEKRDRFLKLVSSSRFTSRACAGTYFQVMDYSKISDEPDDMLAVRLTKEKKLAGIPLSAFYHDKHDAKLLRFCFAKKDETLEKAAEIICSL